MFSGPPSMGRPFVMASLLNRSGTEIRRDPKRSDLYALRPRKTPERQRKDLLACIYDYAPRTLLGRFLPDDGSAAAFIHSCYSREAWRRNWTRMVIKLVAASLVWPLATVAAMLRFTSRNGCTIRRRTGKGLARQLCEQFYLSMAYSILPRWYYIFELHDDALRRKAGGYLLRFETKRGVYRTLKEGRASLSPLSDKAAFASKCATCRIPAVPVILSADRGIVTWNISDATLPPIDLFIKPSSSKGGRGVERWDYESSKGYRNVTGASLTEQEVLQRLMTLSRERERVHPATPRGEPPAHRRPEQWGALDAAHHDLPQ